MFFLLRRVAGYRLTGADHTGAALDGARAIITGIGQSRDPWIGAGVAVHRGLAFLGGAGEEGQGRRWLDELLAMPALRNASAVRAKALTAAGGIAYWQGDAAARVYYEEALAIHRSLGDAQGIADSLQNLAFTVMAADVDAGVRLFRESLAATESWATSATSPASPARSPTRA